jgi:serine/threonine-protein kinase
MILVEIGRFEEARTRLHLAISIDPETPLAHRNIARIHAFCGEWDKVEPALQRAVVTEGLTSLWAHRARFATWTRNKELGRQYLAQLAEHGDISFPRRMLALLIDENPAIVAEFERLTTMADGGQRRRIFFNQLAAEVSGLIHQPDNSIESASRAVDLGLIDLAWLDICPLLDDARKHPSFPALRARVEERAGAILAAYRTL